MISEAVGPFLPGGGGVLQFDDLRLAEIDRYQAVLEVLLDGGQRHVERLHVTDGGEQVLPGVTCAAEGQLVPGVAQLPAGGVSQPVVPAL